MYQSNTNTCINQKEKKNILQSVHCSHSKTIFDVSRLFPHPPKITQNLPSPKKKQNTKKYQYKESWGAGKVRFSAKCIFQFIFGNANISLRTLVQRLFVVLQLYLGISEHRLVIGEILDFERSRMLVLFLLMFLFQLKLKKHISAELRKKSTTTLILCCCPQA